LLGFWLSRLSDAGCGPFLINVHYKAEQVASFVKASPHCSSITLAYEAQLLGTAGTLMENLDFFRGEDGMLIHADNFCLADMRAFIQAHRQRPSGCLMSMLTFRTDDPSSCGIVELNAQGIVIAFEEKPLRPVGNLANGAIYILSAELLERLRHTKPAPTDFSLQVLPGLMGSILSHETTDPLIDIGTPASYERANALRWSRPGDPSVARRVHGSG
jgi:mannose-1-phosphate guanylyltransferase